MTDWQQIGLGVGVLMLVLALAFIDWEHGDNEIETNNEEEMAALGRAVERAKRMNT